MGFGKTMIIGVISSVLVALFVLVGVMSNIFTSSDNKVEEACETGIGGITGVKPDLSPWNGDPETNMNGMSGEEAKVVNPEVVQPVDKNVTAPSLPLLSFDFNNCDRDYGADDPDHHG